MYGYIIGTVEEINTNSIILNNNNIGYIINVPNPYSFNLNNEYKIYLWTHIKEDEHLLYGFMNMEEKDMFLRLISVKGLGPKMALPMLATGSIESLKDAIERENILYLKKFPKIGDKVARQIILDIKGKLTSTDTTTKTNQELFDVLVGLGYKLPDIKRISNNINYEEPLENQIKEALKLLLK